MKLRCGCGNKQFKAPRVTLILHGLPCEITEDGPQFDDGEACHSEGWDFNWESRVACVACGKEYDIGQDEDSNICLEPVREGS